MATDGHSQADATIAVCGGPHSEASSAIAESQDRRAGSTNATVAQLIYELRARGVPASEEGGNPLTDSPAVQLILSLFRLADHPGEALLRVSFGRIAVGMACQLNGHDDVAGSSRLARHFRRELIGDAVMGGPSTDGRLDSAAL